MTAHPPGFLLRVDVAQWRHHQQGVLEQYGPGLVPVCKGNGYGVGNARLATECARLGVTTMCVGTEWEIGCALASFAGEVLVLTPWHPATSQPLEEITDDERVLHTASHVDGVRRLLDAGRRVVVECRTSMNRHGLDEAGVAAVAPLLRTAGGRLGGWALHLPIVRGHGTDSVAEVTATITRLRALALPVTSVWVSHLEPHEVELLERRHPGVAIRPRVGTRLWLGSRSAMRCAGTVMDVQPLARGQRSGYRQRRTPSPGHLLVVAGGTAHGVALEAPKPISGPVSRAKVLAIGMLAAGNRSMSPFSWAGRQRWFVEPPHMQVSLLHLPDDVDPPRIGDELACRVRLTTVHPDAVVEI